MAILLTNAAKNPFYGDQIEHENVTQSCHNGSVKYGNQRAWCSIRWDMKSRSDVSKVRGVSRSMGSCNLTEELPESALSGLDARAASKNRTQTGLVHVMQSFATRDGDGMSCQDYTARH